MPEYPKHLPSFSYVGCHRYFLTFCTHNRLPRFTDADTVQSVLSHFLRVGSEEAIEITAYCFMPDHLHMVVEGKADHSDLKRFISRSKQFSGYAYSQCHDTARLWQRYGYERVLRDDEPTQMAVAYTLENPVRAGLAKEPRDYPFIGSSAFTVDQLLEYAFGRSAGNRAS